MAIKQLNEEQVRTWTLEQKDRWWLENVFRGDMPQLTLRSALTGFILGGILSATNLYIGAKTGWSLGVGITSVILAFAMFRVLSAAGRTRVSRRVFALILAIIILGSTALVWKSGLRLHWFAPGSLAAMAALGVGGLLTALAVWRVLVSPMHEFTILENNAMQSIATAAGYMTAPLISSLAAYMIIDNRLLPWHQMMIWNIVLSILGVLFAFPMKRRFINDEQHPFPEGRAAGVVMDTLHSSDAAVGVAKARIMMWAAGLAGFVKLLQAEGIQEWLQFRVLRLHQGLQTQIHALEGQIKAAPERAKELGAQLAPLREQLTAKLLYFPEQLDVLAVKLGMKPPKIANIDVRQLTITPALDLALIGAGGLMGIKGGISLLIGAVLNYFILVPWMASIGELKPVSGVVAEGTAVFGLRQITLWSLWPGVACMVVASFVAFFAKPQVIIGAFKGLFGKRDGSTDVLKGIEFPLWISIVGIPIFSFLAAYLGHLYFGVDIWVSLVGLPLTFVLALVAANSTALTSTTPVGATSKITQLFYGVVQPGKIHTNIATAGITAEVVSNASNLLMDIKPGYMLGAKPRQQAIGHIIGIFAGALASVPLFFILFTKNVEERGIESIQSDQFPMPSVTVWKAVAEVLTQGLHMLPPSVVYAVIVAALVGLTLEVARIVTRGKFPLSAIGLGLAFVINFQSSFAMFLGALFFWIMGVGRVKEPEAARGNLWIENHEPICAGVIAGAALVGIADAIITNFVLL